MKRCCTLILCFAFLVVIGVLGAIGTKLYFSRGHIKVNSPPKDNEDEENREQQATKTETPVNLRKPLLICTIGQNFETVENVAKGSLAFPCEYIIYTEVIAVEEKFIPIFGNISWFSYLEMLRHVPAVNGGVSISLAEGTQAGGTLDRLASLEVSIKELYKNRLLAMGTFDCDPTALDMSHIKKMYETLEKSRYGVPDVMLYLGVVISSNIVGEAFIEQATKIKKIDTIILQTHITLKENSYGGHVDCHTYPISALGPKNLANSSQPTLQVAEYTVNVSRLKGDLFRLMFSSTLGVMVYASQEKVNLSRFREPCMSYNMGDFDLTCSDEKMVELIDETDMSQYAFTRDNRFMIVYDSTRSIKMKMERYVPLYSDGWCLFDVQRDVYWACPGIVETEKGLMKRVSNVSTILKAIKRG